MFRQRITRELRLARDRTQGLTSLISGGPQTEPLAVRDIQSALANAGPGHNDSNGIGSLLHVL